jgi:predicted phage terminase large subunit-like protein
VLVSQRFPSWLLGQKPLERVKLACYNITHAARFGKIIRDLLQSPEFAQMFPASETRLPNTTSAEEWSTAGRAALRDAQPSFKALGLATGFVGQAADTLLIDDPYSSPQDALSETIRESTWLFWTASAKVRLNDDTNVVVMFHRYHEDDLAGRLWHEGEWEMMRYPAIADESARWPALPPGRKVGEKLSPRISDAFLADMQSMPSIWLGQFQGIPLPPGGGLIKRSYFRTITPEQVPPLEAAVIGVDLAVSAKTSADYTVALPLGVDAENRYYLFRPARGQWEPPDARREIMTRIATFGKARRIGVESVASQSGYVTELRREPAMRGYAIIDIGRHGDKVLLASGWIPIAEQGRIYLVDDGSGWTETFLRECESFPLGTHDDQVDSVGIAFATSPRKREWNVG